MNIQVLASGQRGLLITRRFNASRELVFEASTRPELVRRWLGVRGGWTLSTCEIDLRVGGKYRYVWNHEAKGKSMGCGGEFRQIDKPGLLVYSETFDDPWYEGEALVTVTFEDADGGATLMKMLVEYGSEETRDGVMKSGLEKGVEESYLTLDQILATLA